MAKQYKGSLSLEWFNKQKSIVALDENSIKSENDIPAPRINWINKDEALFYELNTEEGKGNTPYWVNRDDIRVKEARPLVFQKAYKAVQKDKKGTLPGTDTEFVVEEITNEEDALDFDNILIKGDNLLSLNSLKKHFDKLPDNEKIKCIYIDPPYNTLSAFEHYEDNLEHSEWLTLMRDRLTLLRELLSNEGVIFIQCDDNEMAYLKILLDEVFGRDKFVNTISVNMKNVAGASGGGEDSRLKKNIEYIHLYCKDYDSISFKNAYDLIPVGELVETYRAENKSWKYTSVLFDKGEKEYLASTLDGDGNEIKIYYRHNPVFKSINQIMSEENISEKDAYSKYALSIFQTQMPQSSIRPRVMKKVKEMGITHDFFSIEYVPRSGRNKDKLYEQFYKGDNFRLLAWLSDVSEEIDGVLYKKEMQGTYWDFASATKNLAKEGEVLFPNGKKPESLIQRIIEMTTNEKDLVLDIFGGSGTSFAVAHKTNRRWIGVEIGNHADTHIIPRLNSILAGIDNSGITENVNWQGGGSYKYYHLGQSIINVDKETGKGEFNWALGKQFIQESLLVSYDFVVQKAIDVFPAQIFKDNTAPTVGKFLGKNNKSIYGLSFLVAPGEKEVTISNEEIKSIYNVIRKQSDFYSLVIYTNKGIDVAQDAMPEDMDIIKVPHAIFSELER